MFLFNYLPLVLVTSVRAAASSELSVQNNIVIIMMIIIIFIIIISSIISTIISINISINISIRIIISISIHIFSAQKNRETSASIGRAGAAEK